MHIGQSRPSHKMKVETNLLQKLVYFIVSLIICLIVSSQNIYPQTNDDCLMCHEDNTLTTERNGKEVSLYVSSKVFAHSVHGKLKCVSCHVGFDPNEMPHKENITPINCLTCHRNAPIKHSFHPQLLKANGMNGSPDMSCKNCHGTHDIASPKNPDSKWGKNNLVNSCGKCHSSEVKQYTQSLHYQGFKNKVAGAPYCLTCHKYSVADISGKEDITKLKQAQEKLCLSCHLNNPEVRGRTAPSAGFISAYEHSVHGSALQKGNGKVATCINCHSAHEILPGSNPKSTVYKTNVPNTCGQCHTDIEKTYEASIHGQEIAKGNLDAPVCTDCHGEHNILQPSNPNSPVAYQNVSTQVCSPCHSSVKLTRKYGLSPDRFKTYMSSYHGLALEGGSTIVANCASCHGVHNILPASDPKSTINKKNLAKTCGKCHPGANQNFAVGKIHVTVAEKTEPILYWISSAYIFLIILVIGFMFLHNLFDFIKKAKIKKLKQSGMLRAEEHGHGLYLRMTVNERIQHILLAVSFITLVITGFMLRFPNTWWVQHIRDLSEYTFEIRSILHRIAAVIMITVSVYHIGYLIFTKRGRQLFKDLLPKYKDLTDAIGVASFNLGISKQKPKLDRFSYVEKSEYWALVWGTIVMSITGIIMWFDNTFIGLFTKLGWDIANTIHYYEAWLAFLAIVVWHFYFIIFNPDVYPMNTAWFNGKVSEEEMEEEHPLELKKIKEARIETENNKLDDK